MITAGYKNSCCFVRLVWEFFSILQEDFNCIETAMSFSISIDTEILWEKAQKSEFIN